MKSHFNIFPLNHYLGILNKVLLLIVLFYVTFIGSVLFANDTGMTIVGGQIAYVKSDDISIEEEILKISLDEIHVSYIFKNHSPEEILTHVAFPLPPTPFLPLHFVFPPSWDETYHAYRLLGDKITRLELEKNLKTNISLIKTLSDAPFINFKRTVEGVNYGYTYKIQAIDTHGNDITETLEKNSIPLSSIYVQGFELPEFPLEKDPILKKNLQDLKLLTTETKEQIAYPNWQVKITYLWDQSFKPHSLTNVTHSYKPHVGYHWLVKSTLVKSLEDLKIVHRDFLPTGEEEPKNIKDFCPSESQKKEIIDLFNQDTSSEELNSIQKFFQWFNHTFMKKSPSISHNMRTSYRIKEVRYILSTGGNWKGPIKNFRLEIIPPTQKCLVLCCFEGKISKDKKGVYVSEIKNLNPKSELKVLFIDPMNFGEEF